ncbi:hypothetical protein HOH87_00930 [bacterium]|jgi:hypothetical protein|nr:hypothetical protein [bacterium]
MKSEVLQQFPHIQLTGFAMLLFLGSFIAVAIQTFKRSARPTFQRISELPLEDN